jgi:hypothetical protein
VCKVCEETICNECRNGKMQHCHRCAQILLLSCVAV